MQDYDNNKIKLNFFQLRNIHILKHLYENNAITDEIVEIIRQSELDYIGLLEKYRLLKYKMNKDDGE